MTQYTIKSRRKAGRTKLISKILSLSSSGFAGLLATVVLLSSASEKAPTLPETKEVKLLNLQKKIDKLETENLQNHQELERIEKTYRANLMEQPDKHSNYSSLDLEERFTRVEKQIQSLDAAILDNPIKAISLPLIQKDMENLKISIKAENDNLKANIYNLQMLFNWLTGTVILGALSVFVQAIPFIRGLFANR